MNLAFRSSTGFLSIALIVAVYLLGFVPHVASTDFDTQESQEYDSSPNSSDDWSTFGQESTTTSGYQSSSQQEGIKVEFAVDLSGEINSENLLDSEPNTIELKGTTRVQSSRLKRYFQAMKRRSQSGSYGQSRSYYQRSDSDSSSSQSRRNLQSFNQNQGSGDSFTESSGFSNWNDGTSVSIQDAHFKLLHLKPNIGTRDVTVEVYFGDDPFSPHLEVVNQKLNPFKKTPFDLVNTSLSENEFRKVEVMVRIVSSTSEAQKDQKVTAKLKCYLFLVDFDTGGSGAGWTDSGPVGDEDAEIQWVEDEDNNSDVGDTGGSVDDQNSHDWDDFEE